MQTFSVSYLGWRDAAAEVIFQAAREAGAVSKDSDFLKRVFRLGTPPQLLYGTGGNTALMAVFTRHFRQAHELLAGDAVAGLS